MISRIFHNICYVFYLVVSQLFCTSRWSWRMWEVWGKVLLASRWIHRVCGVWWVSRNFSYYKYLQNARNFSNYKYLQNVRINNYPVYVIMLVRNNSKIPWKHPWQEKCDIWGATITQVGYSKLYLQLMVPF